VAAAVVAADGVVADFTAVAADAVAEAVRDLGAEHGRVAARDLAVDTMEARGPGEVVTRIERLQCRDRAAAAGPRSTCRVAGGLRWVDFPRRALGQAADKSRDPAAAVGPVAGRSRGLVVAVGPVGGRSRDPVAAVGPVAGRLLVVLAASHDPVAVGDLHNVI
jgi:hypothetical protein